MKALTDHKGARIDADGNRLPTPYRCCRCDEDACYFDGINWLCTRDWLTKENEPCGC